MRMHQDGTTQGPGFYRHRVGDCVVTALYDGYIRLAPSLFHGVAEEERNRLLEDAFQSPTGDGAPTAVTTYLIDDGKRILLLNAGGARRVGDTMGRLLPNMAAAGYRPEDVSGILLTHLHFDHVCGLADAEGAAVFPRAKVFVSNAECDFWLSPETARQAPEENRAFFAMAAESMAPYEKRGDVVRFNPDAEVWPGIRAKSTPGHTPGHVSYLLESGGGKLLLWGDIVHSRAMQFRHPEISNDFDGDPLRAVASREAVFRESAREQWLVGGDHLPFPGLGHVLERKPGYEWVPVDYASLAPLTP